MTPIPLRRQKIMTRQLRTRPTQKIEREPRPSIVRKLMSMHWLFLVGLGMMAALILWIIGSVVLAWGTQRYYDIRYGTPRTYQVDQVVGQGGDSPAYPSHFIAINENHEAVVIELRADDPAKSITYTTPVYNGDSEAPVTLEFRDVSGDGKLDMIVHIHLPSQEQIGVYINAGDQFRSVTGSDHIKL